MKEKIGKKEIARRIFGVVLAVAMVVALMPMNSLTVYADGETTWGDIKSTIVLPTGVTLPTVDDATTVTQVTSDFGFMRLL